MNACEWRVRDVFQSPSRPHCQCCAPSCSRYPALGNRQTGAHTGAFISRVQIAWMRFFTLINRLQQLLRSECFLWRFYAFLYYFQTLFYTIAALFEWAAKSVYETVSHQGLCVLAFINNITHNVSSNFMFYYLFIVCLWRFQELAWFVIYYRIIEVIHIFLVYFKNISIFIYIIVPK